MEQLRSEIRAAFEKEQAAYPPVAAIRRSVLEAATINQRRGTNYQWLALVAAVVIGILVVVGLLSTRLGHRASVPVSPEVKTVPDYGPPPPGVPLLYLLDSRYPSWRIGYDWQGQPRGTLKFEPPIWPAGSPDGGFFVTYQADYQTMTFLDRLGQPIPIDVGRAWVGLSEDDVKWADDNRHVCGASKDQKTYEWTLSTQLPGEAAKPVAVFTRDSNAGQPYQPPLGQLDFGPRYEISVVSCSFRNNQAILARRPDTAGQEVWVTRLSDGKEISHHHIPSGGSIAAMVASTDGAFIAENTNPVLIRRVADWTVVATLVLDGRVSAFSGDGSLILVSSSHDTRIVDWRLRHVKWVMANMDTKVVVGLVTEPSGRSFALELAGYGSTGAHEVLIVRGDGTTTDISGHELAYGKFAGYRRV